MKEYLENYVKSVVIRLMLITRTMFRKETMLLDKIKRFATRNKITYQIIYICFVLHEKFLSFLYLLMRMYPINKKKIVFCSAKGVRYGDNPMYISDELIRRNKDYEIVWLLDKSVRVDLPIEVKRCNYDLISVIYELATAKVWVDSNLKYSGFLKRKGQLYIQTWHGSYGLKKIAGDLGDKLSQIDKRNHKYNAKRTDIMISNSMRTTEIYRRAFGYKGRILEYGSPRNDLFFRDIKRCSEKVNNYFRLTTQSIVLYAPTFRNDYRTDDLKIDYERLREVLNRKFGGEWIVLIRLHPFNLIDADDFMEYTDTVLNASEYSIMQELLVASDILITDYSSCMFDFATTKKPCFLYATDVARYEAERGNYFRLDELPFPVAENNEQLEKVILTYNPIKYEKELSMLFDKVGLNETGHASEKVADYIEEWMADN